MSTPPKSSVFPIRWQPYCLELLDQLVLPHEKVYRKFSTPEGTAEAIRTMIVRGAPAIGIAAAYGMTLAVKEGLQEPSAALRARVDAAASLLMSSRPTAVNLAWGVKRVQHVVHDALNEGVSTQEVLDRAEAAANAIMKDDVSRNLALSEYGAALLPEKARVLTHCNAGALATGGHGTALGVLRTANAHGKDVTVWVDETRPFLQGARLTMYELLEDGIPATLITDNMAGHLMSQGMVDAVIVGTDRTVANGDVANKIGTYTLAVLCARHEIPFYVACPLSTLDLDTENGDKIPIEQRDPTEVKSVAGTLLAPEGSAALHPAFDVTPAELVTAIITEAGVAQAPYSTSLPKLKAAAPYEES